jgi:hypothetical protein
MCHLRFAAAPIVRNCRTLVWLAAIARIGRTGVVVSNPNPGSAYS